MIRACVRPTQPTDASWLAPRLRTADKNEIDALVGLSHQEALQVSSGASVAPFTIVDAHDLPIAMMGCHRDASIPWVGYIWLLGSNGITDIRIPFLRQSKLWLPVLGQPFRVLTNVVDERNKTHIKWLRWIGFTFVKRHEQMGVQKRPFYEFIRII